MFVVGTIICKELATFAGELCSIELITELPVQCPSNRLSNGSRWNCFLQFECRNIMLTLFFFTVTVNVDLGEGVSRFVM